MFSDIRLEERVPAAHPLRKLRGVVDALLATMNREFEAVDARRGRPSVPPEMLLKVMPHVAAEDKHSAVDGCIRRHEGHQTWRHRWLVGRASCVKQEGQCAQNGRDGLKTGTGDSRHRRATPSEPPQASKSGDAACLISTFSAFFNHHTKGELHELRASESNAQ
jgi:hypothetical protein